VIVPFHQRHILGAPGTTFSMVAMSAYNSTVVRVSLFLIWSALSFFLKNKGYSLKIQLKEN
jgi:hypothetical protein